MAASCFVAVALVASSIFVASVRFSADISRYIPGIILYVTPACCLWFVSGDGLAKVSFFLWCRKNASIIDAASQDANF